LNSIAKKCIAIIFANFLESFRDENMSRGNIKYESTLYNPNKIVGHIKGIVRVQNIEQLIQ
jgi:hypothetical protein